MTINQNWHRYRLVYFLPLLFAMIKPNKKQKYWGHCIFTSTRHIWLLFQVQQGNSVSIAFSILDLQYDTIKYFKFVFYSIWIEQRSSVRRNEKKVLKNCCSSNYILLANHSFCYSSQKTSSVSKNELSKWHAYSVTLDLGLIHVIWK